jgi:putative oxidoreductase
VAARTLAAPAATDLVRALQILAATQFFLTGLDKLGDAPPMVQLFAAVGLGQWFRYFTGTVEVLGAVMLLIPAVTHIGAALLALTMIGALIAHVTVIPFSPIKAVVLLLMVTVVLWHRRPQSRPQTS